MDDQHHSRSRSHVSKHDIRYLLEQPNRTTTSTSNSSTSKSSRHHSHHPSAPSTPPPRPSSSSRHIGSPVSSSTHGHHLRCKHCKYVAPSQDDLQHHVTRSHKSSSKGHICPLCNKSFAEKGNLNKHHKVTHLKQRNHKCGTCERTFAFKDGLTRHVAMVHLNQRPFECQECLCPSGPHSSAVPCTLKCGIRFKQKSHQRRHVTSVHHSGKSLERYDTDGL